MPIPKIKVSSMTSHKTGSPVANQFIITTEEGQYFQSYQSIIAFIPNALGVEGRGEEGKILLDEYYWDYSRTTTKYRNAFLGENTAETRKKIKSGEYLLTNLN